MITDGGAPITATLRLERSDWRFTALSGGSVAAIPWTDWEFVLGGFGR